MSKIKQKEHKNLDPDELDPPEVISKKRKHKMIID